MIACARHVQLVPRHAVHGIRRARRALAAAAVITGCAGAIATPTVLSRAPLYAPGINPAAGDQPGFTGDAPVPIPEPGSLTVLAVGVAFVITGRKLAA